MVLWEILGFLSERIFCQSHIASLGKHSEAEVWSLITAYRKITAGCNQDPIMFPSSPGHHTMKQGVAHFCYRSQTEEAVRGVSVLAIFLCRQVIKEMQCR